MLGQEMKMSLEQILPCTSYSNETTGYLALRHASKIILMVHRFGGTVHLFPQITAARLK